MTIRRLTEIMLGMQAWSPETRERLAWLQRNHRRTRSGEPAGSSGDVDPSERNPWVQYKDGTAGTTPKNIPFPKPPPQLDPEVVKAAKEKEEERKRGEKGRKEGKRAIQEGRGCHLVVAPGPFSS